MLLYSLLCCILSLSVVSFVEGWHHKKLFLSFIFSTAVFINAVTESLKSVKWLLVNVLGQGWLEYWNLWALLHLLRCWTFRLVLYYFICISWCLFLHSFLISCFLWYSTGCWCCSGLYNANCLIWYVSDVALVYLYLISLLLKCLSTLLFLCWLLSDCCCFCKDDANVLLSDILFAILLVLWCSPSSGWGAACFCVIVHKQEWSNMYSWLPDWFSVACCLQGVGAVFEEVGFVVLSHIPSVSFSCHVKLL